LPKFVQIFLKFRLICLFCNKFPRGLGDAVASHASPAPTALLHITVIWLCENMQIIPVQSAMLGKLKSVDFCTNKHLQFERKMKLFSATFLHFCSCYRRYRWRLG